MFLAENGGRPGLLVFRYGTEYRKDVMGSYFEEVIDIMNDSGEDC